MLAACSYAVYDSLGSLGHLWINQLVNQSICDLHMLRLSPTWTCFIIHWKDFPPLTSRPRQQQQAILEMYQPFSLLRYGRFPPLNPAQDVVRASDLRCGRLHPTRCWAECKQLHPAIQALPHIPILYSLLLELIRKAIPRDRTDWS